MNQNVGVFARPEITRSHRSSEVDELLPSRIQEALKIAKINEAKARKTVKTTVIKSLAW